LLFFPFPFLFSLIYYERVFDEERGREKEKPKKPVALGSCNNNFHY